MRHAFVGLVLTLLLAGCPSTSEKAEPEESEKNLQAYRDWGGGIALFQADSPRAYGRLHAAFNADDPPLPPGMRAGTAYRMGVLMRKGLGTEKDEAGGMKLIEWAAEQGYEGAQTYLADARRQGNSEARIADARRRESEAIAAAKRVCVEAQVETWKGRAEEARALEGGNLSIHAEARRHYMASESRILAFYESELGRKLQDEAARFSLDLLRTENLAGLSELAWAIADSQYVISEDPEVFETTTKHALDCLAVSADLKRHLDEALNRPDLADPHGTLRSLWSRCVGARQSAYAIRVMVSVRKGDLQAARRDLAALEKLDPPEDVLKALRKIVR